MSGKAVRNVLNITSAGLLGASLGFLPAGPWSVGCVLLAFGIVGQVIVHTWIWREHHEHRRTAGDRDDPDPGTNPGAAAFTAGFTAGLTGNTFSNVTFTPFTPPAAGVTERTADVPILAYKCATLAYAPPGQFWLHGGYTKERMTETAIARCSDLHRLLRTPLGMSTEPAHRSPDPGCTCGYYAVSNRDDLHHGYGTVVVDVELSGKVIVHERGYRAEHQRVLAVDLGGCWYCGGELSCVAVVETSVRAGDRLHPITQPRPVCAAHANVHPVTVALITVARAIGLPGLVRPELDA